MKIAFQSILSLLTIHMASSQTIVQVASGNADFTILVNLVSDAGLVDTLSGPGPFTVFAPVNDAFAAVPAKFLTDPYAAHLSNILTYHVLSGRVESGDLSVGLVAEAVNGEDLSVTSLTPVQINGVDVIQPDVDASNGIIHVVDEVLLPNAATKSIYDLVSEDPELTDLKSLLTQPNLIELLSGDGSYTFFAPTNAAIAALDAATTAAVQSDAQLLANVLTYHVIGDAIILSTDLALGAMVPTELTVPVTVTSVDPPMIDMAGVAAADILANNGVIHKIDAVLTPQVTPPKNIVDVASLFSSLSTLVGAVAGADLVGDLSSPGPFTVFAPINDAFDAVPSKFLTDAYAAHLKNILLYHVLGSKVESGDLSEGLVATTLNQEDINVTSLVPTVQINGLVDVIAADVGGSNGVIHIIDQVLLPDAATKSIVDMVVENDELATLESLLPDAVISVLSGEGPFTLFAPTEAAFAALDAETLAAVQGDADLLLDVLKYHVVEGSIILSSQLTNGAMVPTLEGSSVTVTSLNPPTIDESGVVKADILANNGVIHWIDAVLIPPTPSSAPTSEKATIAPTGSPTESTSAASGNNKAQFVAVVAMAISVFAGLVF